MDLASYEPIGLQSKVQVLQMVSEEMLGSCGSTRLKTQGQNTLLQTTTDAADFSRKSGRMQAETLLHWTDGWMDGWVDLWMDGYRKP